MSFLFVPAGALYYLYQRRKRNSQKSDEVPLWSCIFFWIISVRLWSMASVYSRYCNRSILTCFYKHNVCKHTQAWKRQKCKKNFLLPRTSVDPLLWILESHRSHDNWQCNNQNLDYYSKKWNLLLDFRWEAHSIKNPNLFKDLWYLRKNLRTV